MPNSKKPKSAPKAQPAKAPKAAAVRKPAPAAKSASSGKAQAPAGKPAAAKSAPAAKAPPPAKAQPPAKPAPAPKGAPKPAPASGPAGKAAAKADALRARILQRRTAAKPIAFTLAEVREIAKTNVGRADEKNGAEGKTTNGKPKNPVDEIEAKLKKAAQPHHVKPASLADILGYNPAKQAAPGILDVDQLDPKFQRYYKLLADLRDHVVNGLNTHTEETLKRSAKDDSGDLSGYAQHMADAGTDTFDRDFALSLVSNEQEALAEIDAAIQRIRNGTYGICELTGKPISKERLLAVPFARYSVESQVEVERTKRRSAQRGGLFGEGGEEGGKIEDDSGGED
jgi:RNA polymerase-binding transcription factor DksA